MRRNTRPARLFNAFRLLALIATVFALTGCPPVSDEALNRAYQAAIADAAVAEPGEICRNLTAIVEYNRELIWDAGAPRSKRVLMVTWTSWDGYDALVGQKYTTPWDFWVTAAPQVKQFCGRHRVGPNEMNLRLEQLLGLPPHAGKTRFVEFWVNPDDLFRPSPDPEITDHEAELDFPRSGQFVTVAQSHIDWFDNLTSQSYGVDGYPWTRLGYTYDWGNPWSDVGLSEFVIGGGAEVTVHSVAATAEYCRWWN